MRGVAGRFREGDRAPLPSGKILEQQGDVGVRAGAKGTDPLRRLFPPQRHLVDSPSAGWCLNPWSCSLAYWRRGEVWQHL